MRAARRIMCRHADSEWNVTGENNFMINFEEELKNFKPSLEVEEVEQAIYSHESVDIMDMMQELISISRGE